MASGSTGNYSIPYPVPTDPVNVTGDIEALATRIDNILQEEIEDTSAAMWTGGVFTNGLQTPVYNDSTGKMSMSLAQDIQSSASPTFVDITATNQLISSVSTGVAPISVSSSTVVDNLNSDLLDGEEGAYYLDWTNVTNKPGPTITLLGDVSGSATLTDLTSASVTVVVNNDSHSHTGITISDLDASDITTGTLSVVRGGTGVNTSTGSTSVVLSDSPTLTGIPISTTASVDTNTNQIATTAFVINQEYLKVSTASATYAPIDTPTFTGSLFSEGSEITFLSSASAGVSNFSLKVERGSDPDVSIRWNESGDTWQFTNDGTNFVDIGSGGGGAGLDAVLFLAGC